MPAAGALNEKRLEFFLDRFESLRHDPEIPPFRERLGGLWRGAGNEMEGAVSLSSCPSMRRTTVRYLCSHTFPCPIPPWALLHTPAPAIPSTLPRPHAPTPTPLNLAYTHHALSCRRLWLTLSLRYSAVATLPTSYLYDPLPPTPRLWLALLLRRHGDVLPHPAGALHGHEPRAAGAAGAQHAQQAMQQAGGAGRLGKRAAMCRGFFGGC